MSTGRDPLGKRALFSKSDSQISADRDFGIDDEPDGSEAKGPLIREPETIEPGGVTVECSECGKTSEVSLMDLGKAAVPLPVFIPFRKYPSLLKCPKCEERTWMRIRWTS